MTTPAERGLAEMRRVVVPVRDGQTEGERRERLAASFNGMAARARARRVRQKWSAPLLVAAAVLLALGSTAIWREFGGRRPATETAVVAGPMLRVLSGRLDAGGTWYSVGTAVGFGSQELAAGDEPADVLLPSGAVVQIAEHTRLRVAHPSRPGDELLDLRSGRVALRVPKLGERSLQVTTPRATVTVHGTQFTVAVQGASGASYTTVTVAEGLVSVRSPSEMVMLGPGGTWSSQQKPPPSESDRFEFGAPAAPSETAAPPAPLASTQAHASKPSTQPPPKVPRTKSQQDDVRPAASAEGPSEVVQQPAPEPSVPSGAVRAPEAAPRTTLVEENRLYQGAMHAKRNGMDELALQRVDELLTRFPSSPLAASARLERQRLVERLKQTQRSDASTP